MEPREGLCCVTPGLSPQRLLKGPPATYRRLFCEPSQPPKTMLFCIKYTKKLFLKIKVPGGTLSK